MTDLIIFDVDGTLIDSAKLILDAQRLTAEALGLVHPGREAGFAVVGRSLEVALIDLFGDVVAPERMVEAYKDIFHGLRGQPGYEEPMFPGVPALLSGLAARPDTLLAIATGKANRGVRHIIEKHGWDGLFVSVQTADTAPSKPAPGMILNALAEAGAEPARTVMIGDSVHDMAMARAAGVKAIAVAWGFQPPALLMAAGADALAQEVAELPAVIARLIAPAEPVPG
jgi:phosphoglycolate phosphatase